MKHESHQGARPSRRAVVAGGLAGLAASWGGVPLRFGVAADETSPTPPTSAPLKHLIVLWMAGGPSHIDTFDPKPGRPVGGPFQAIPTALDGVSFGEHLPRLAATAGDLAIVRSLTSKEGAHERAVHLWQTGYPPNATVAYPHVGAWIARARGAPETDLPAFVAVGGTTGSGVLGPAWAPFTVADINRPLTNLVPRGVPASRRTRRAALLAALGGPLAGREDSAVPAAQTEAREQALKLMASPHAKAFDIQAESEAVRKHYGETRFGRACLLARRLVEADVRVVHLTLGGWDNHREAFPAITRLCGEVDPAFAALVGDLKERGLLSSTLVAWMGEFGRTPDINATRGRDHFPHAMSAVLAGGGVPGGVVVGRTDDDGRKVVERPVAPGDLTATLLTLAGLDVSERFITRSGRPITPAPTGSQTVPELLPAALRPAPA